jgi:hypothetical protein
MTRRISVNIISWILFIAGPVWIISCYPDGPETTEDLDLVGTMYDKEFDFTAVNTFSLPDTIIHIVEDGGESDMDRTHDELIIDRVRDHMISLGYTEEPLDTLDPANVVLLITAISTTSTGIYYDPAWWGYWGWWPGWGGYPGYPGWGPGWGYGYPWGYPVHYSYSSGSLFINMVDPDDTDLDEKTISVRWMAVLNALLEGSKQQAEQRITDGIDQAFKQSPYLKKTE